MKDSAVADIERVLTPEQLAAISLYAEKMGSPRVSNWEKFQRGGIIVLLSVVAWMSQQAWQATQAKQVDQDQEIAKTSAEVSEARKELVEVGKAVAINLKATQELLRDGDQRDEQIRWLRDRQDDLLLLGPARRALEPRDDDG